MRALAAFVSVVTTAVSVGCSRQSPHVEAKRLDGRIEACLAAMTNGNMRIASQYDYADDLRNGIQSVSNQAKRIAVVQDVAARLLAADILLQNEDYTRYEMEVGRFWWCARVVQGIMRKCKEEDMWLRFYVASWQKFKRLCFAVPRESQRENESEMDYWHRKACAYNLFADYANQTNYWRFLVEPKYRAELKPNTREELIRWHKEFANFPSREAMSRTLHPRFGGRFGKPKTNAYDNIKLKESSK